MRVNGSAQGRPAASLRQAVIVGVALMGFVSAAPARAAGPCGLDNCAVMWNKVLIDVIDKTSFWQVDGPPEVANQIAIVGNAMFNAVNAVTGMTYQPSQYSVGANYNANADAAALAAGYGAMMGLFARPNEAGNPLAGSGLTDSQTFGGLLYSRPPNQGSAIASAQVLQLINTAFTNAQANLNLGDTAVQNGLALGTAQSLNTLTGRLNDGSITAIVNGIDTPYTMPNANPGTYIPPGARPAMYPQWGSVAHWTGTPGALTDAPAPPGINTAAYAAAILKTECLGGGASALSAGTQAACAAAAGGFNLPATHGKLGSPAGATVSNTDLALYWNDPGTTLQPPGHWLQITDTAAGNNGLDLLATARLTAMVGSAMTDAGIAAWKAKYQYELWRPQDAIRDCVSGWGGGNFATCEAAWASVIVTPPHPDYIAGHPTFSYAAATTLQNIIGGGNDDFCSTSDPYNNGPGNPIAAITVCYDNFLDAASDATTSRVYGGIHTDFASTTGAIIGSAIGDQVSANEFQFVPEPASMTLLGAGGLALLGLRRRRAAA